MQVEPYVAARPGSRDYPFVIRQPGDLDYATRDIPQATPDQAKVDNYRMGHVVVAGLQVTIETPKGKYRFGRNPHGARWHIKMPADYGYINRTEDADGDGIDVYLGPDCHRAAELPVWIIDQRHAHNREFDEHKVMLGFPDVVTVRETYYAGFSDGKGPQRAGAVTRMTFDEFLRWLKMADKEKPVAYRRRESPLDKARAAPIVIEKPGDLERATQDMEQPTPERAQAGNYRMAHVVVGGIPVSIETPRGQLRYGTDADGSRWEVRMPAHYGYVKRTEGSDGDHVDIYLGPDSHRAVELPVWIIDQKHADSLEFDEHKVMAGFPDVTAARSTYYDGFSDGRGPERVGAVVRTTFDKFRQWLQGGRTDRPLAYQVKSASHGTSCAPYGAPDCPCDQCNGPHGGVMSGTQTAPGTATIQPEVKAAGRLTQLMAKVMPRLTAQERSDLFRDAGALASDEIGKASTLLDGGSDRDNIGQVEDQWDGAPDRTVDVTRAHGPGSSAASGATPVGPTQSASGAGAEKMEGEYSRHAPQTGSQAATEKLGRDIAGMRGAMKSFLRAFEGMQTQMNTLQAGTASVHPVDMKPAIDAAVAKAMEPISGDVRKAIKKAVKKAMAKAASTDAAGSAATGTESASGVHKAKKEDDDGEEEDEAAAKAEACAEDDIHREMEADEDKHEGEEESKKAKSAAALRLMAKSRIAWANKRVAKAGSAMALGKAKKAAKALRLARGNLSKASGYLVAAQTLRDGHTGPSTKAIGKALSKARKGVGRSQALNQDQWPSSDDKPVGKAQAEQTGTQVTAQTVSPSPDVTAFSAQVAKALEGMGLLTANVQQMLTAISAGRGGASQGGGNGGLPPVFALAKSGADVQNAEQELARLRDDNIIDMEAFDQARDALNKARMNLPQDIVQAMVAKLPEPARAVLNRKAA